MEGSKQSVTDADTEQMQAFFACVRELCDVDSEKMMMPSLRRRLETPPTALFSAALNMQLSDAQVRRLLFNPNSSDMALYPALLAGDASSPNDLSSNAANKAQVAVLGHLYLVHGRTWQRLRPFIEAGGLRSLAALLSHPNPIVASQALQVLLLATHPDMYDWHSPPSTTTTTNSNSAGSSASSSEASNSSSQLPVSQPNSNLQQQQLLNTSGPCHISAFAPTAASTLGKEGSSHSSDTPQNPHPCHGSDGKLWTELLQLQQGPFLPSLLQLSPDVWPGSGHQALQLLAFYLSWLRTWWSKDDTLQLSQPLLSGLTAWSTRASASSDERQLASRLAEDFGRTAAAAPGASGGPPDAHSAGAAANDNTGSACGNGSSSSAHIEYDSAVELRVVADRTQVNTSPGSEAALLKAAGNDAFKARDWATAIRLYSAALDVPVPAAALLDEAPRRAVYHTNRAAAYLERVWELQGYAAAAAAGSTKAGSSGNSWREVGGLLDGVQLDGFSPDSLERQLAAAVMDCRAALDLVPGYAKAHYRLATALCAQGHLKQAASAAAAAQLHATSAADKAAAARLTAAIAQQQQQQQQHKEPGPMQAAIQPHGSTSNSSSNSSSTRVAQAAPDNAPSAAPAAAAAAAGRTSSCSSSNPLDQLLQKFAAAVCNGPPDRSDPAGRTLLPHGHNAGAPALAARAAESAAAGASVRLDVHDAAAVEDAVGCAGLSGGILSLKLPQDKQRQQQQRGRKGQLGSKGAGKVLVEVLASSDIPDCDSKVDHEHQQLLGGDGKGSCSGKHSSSEKVSGAKQDQQHVGRNEQQQQQWGSLGEAIEVMD